MLMLPKLTMAKCHEISGFFDSSDAFIYQSPSHKWPVFDHTQCEPPTKSQIMPSPWKISSLNNRRVAGL